MEYKTIYLLIVSLFIGTGSINAYAADDQASKDETTVVGACMVQKFGEHVPPITETTINKCADADDSAAPKCLGLTDDEYNALVKFCITQLTNAKCVSTKMKVPLIQYADCGYEKDPAACFKGLGYTADAVVKLSTECQKDAAT